MIELNLKAKEAQEKRRESQYIWGELTPEQMTILKKLYIVPGKTKIIPTTVGKYIYDDFFN